MNKKPKIIDLFCGCGGFGLGAELAGFDTLVAVDIDKTLQSAYKLNFPNTQVINADLSTMGKKEWLKLLGKTEIDGVIGGPPCQGYSRMGVSDPNDSRRGLLFDFYRHINLLKPKFFVMENVEGLMDSKNKIQLDNAIKVLTKAYTVLPPIIIDASEWGAPTKRKRVIVIGYDKKRFPKITLDMLEPPFIKTTVRDAIQDIAEPIPQNKLTHDFGWGPYRKIDKLSEYSKNMRQAPPNGLGDSQASINLKSGQVSGLFETVHSEKVRSRYQNLSEGEIDKISRSKKLSWLGLCPTLRAGTGSDKGSYQAVRPIHPEIGRVISVREAARLQGFPDWFCFHPTKWHSFRMIGNSVSPIISKSILEKMYSNCVL